MAASVDDGVVAGWDYFGIPAGARVDGPPGRLIAGQPVVAGATARIAGMAVTKKAGAMSTGLF